MGSFCVPHRAAVVALTTAWSSSVEGGIFTLVSAVSIVLSRFLSEGMGSGPAVRLFVLNILCPVASCYYRSFCSATAP